MRSSASALIRLMLLACCDALELTQDLVVRRCAQRNLGLPCCTSALELDVPALDRNRVSVETNDVTETANQAINNKNKQMKNPFFFIRNKNKRKQITKLKS
jgi:hypothetical protein